MLPLHDLLPILAVSREWSAAVRSMASIHASLDRDECRLLREGRVFRSLPPIRCIVGSPVLRHVAALHIAHADGSYTPLTHASLALLAHHAPNLQSLWCTLGCTITPHDDDDDDDDEDHDDGYIHTQPAKLQSRQLQFGYGRSVQFTGAEVNGVLSALAALPSLSPLRLQISSFDEVELSLLAACQSLRDLKLETREHSTAQRRPAGSDSFVTRHSAARRRRVDSPGQPRVASSAARHCAMARHRARAVLRVHWRTAPHAAGTHQAATPLPAGHVASRFSAAAARRCAW